MTTHQPIDVAIIGGGPAGYAAAIYAARANLTTTVIEQGMSGGQIATTNEVENYPGIPLLSGAELGERFQQHAEGLGAHAASGRFCWRGYVSRSWRFVLRDV